MSDLPDGNPPDAARVAMRALATSAVVCRGFLESWTKDEAESLHRRIFEWLDAQGLVPELEAWEKEAIENPVGGLSRQTAVNATWRSEALAVLAWALDVYPLPSLDEQVDPADVGNAVGFLDPDARTSCVEGARLRAEEEIEVLAERLFSAHWRLRQFAIRPEPIDFVELAREAWFGPMTIEGLSLVEGDLAFGGVPIAKLDTARLPELMSTIRERRLAAEWLRGNAALMSDVSLDT
jgi:hypothetical protein